MIAEKRIRPFSSGTELLDWTTRNCDRCAKYVLRTDTETGWNTNECNIVNAIADGQWGDGTIPAAIAERKGTEVDCLEWEDSDA